MLLLLPPLAPPVQVGTDLKVNFPVSLMNPSVHLKHRTSAFGILPIIFSQDLVLNDPVKFQIFTHLEFL